MVKQTNIKSWYPVEFYDLGESGDSGKYDTWHMTNLKWFLGINWFGWV